MLIEERTAIEAPPAAVFAFFERIEDHYLDWHPDHITFRWTTDEGFAVGAEAYFEEEIGGNVKRQTIRYHAVDPPERVAFHPTSRLIRILLPSISFTIEPTDDGSLVTQRIRIRTGPIGRRLNRTEFHALREHVREEGEHLKRIVEADA